MRNLSVFAFSVNVRTTSSGTPSGIVASFSSRPSVSLPPDVGGLAHRRRSRLWGTERLHRLEDLAALRGEAVE